MVSTRFFPKMTNFSCVLHLNKSMGMLFAFLGSSILQFLSLTMQGIMSIAIHVLTICVQINDFYDCHFNLALWHMVKIIYNHMSYFKVVLNCK
jgi:hypothetical protein